MSISGNLRTMPFADLLQWVSQSRKTGTLSVEGSPHNKKIYFRNGLIAASSSENPKEFLGYYLVGWGVLGEEELQELLDMQEQYGTLLGELLLIVGRLNREELQHILQVKTEETIYELFLWQEGDFRFLENILPAKKFQPLNLPVEMIILEGVRRKDEWLRCREVIPDETWIPSLVRAVDMEQLGEIELGILREIDGTNSIERIALANRLAFFHVMMFVYQGMAHQLFEVRAPGDEVVPIPGFSKGAWTTMVQRVEEMVGEGDLLAAHRRLGEIRLKYGGDREATKQVEAVQRKIADALGSLQLSNSVVLELAVPPSELISLSCSPQEGFLLSRINGAYSLGEILKMVPGSELENRLVVNNLVQRGVVRHGGR
ncbi:MAG: DUF4388 domain-containing protein [Thermoanaerobaculales bacterium]|nr:DUF4388 domain-containing protein [Thermoanaerobaculales bacterium]